MNVKIGQKVRVKIEVDGGDVVAVFPPRSDTDMIRGVRKLKIAAVGSGRSQNLQKLSRELDETRIAFFDRLCVAVENITYESNDGQEVALTPDTEGWKEMIPESWKIAIVRYFDEKEALSANELGN